MSTRKTTVKKRESRTSEKTEAKPATVSFYLEKEINSKIFQEDIDLIQDSFNVSITDNGGNYTVVAKDGDLAKARKATIVFTKIARDIDKDLEVTEEIIQSYIDPLLFKADEGVLHRPIYKDVNGRMIYPRTKNQEALVKSIDRYLITTVSGPAGTGKTKLALAAGLAMLEDNRYDKIMICRPTTTVGNALGHMPGTLEEKLQVFVQPLYDALEELLGEKMLLEMIKLKKIQFVPTAMIRGANFQDAFIVLDEAQNLSRHEILSLLSRTCYNCKILITGDSSQSDVKHKGESGLDAVMSKLKDIEDVNIVKMVTSDIQRNKIVADIVDAFDD